MPLLLYRTAELAAFDESIKKWLPKVEEFKAEYAEAAASKVSALEQSTGSRYSPSGSGNGGGGGAGGEGNGGSPAREATSRRGEAGASTSAAGQTKSLDERVASIKHMFSEVTAKALRVTPVKARMMSVDPLRNPVYGMPPEQRLAASKKVRWLHPSAPAVASIAGHLCASTIPDWQQSGQSHLCPHRRAPRRRKCSTMCSPSCECPCNALRRCSTR
jgi:hypothetical protein